MSKTRWTDDIEARPDLHTCPNCGGLNMVPLHSTNEKSALAAPRGTLDADGRSTSHPPTSPIPRGPERREVTFVQITDDLFDQLSEPVNTLSDVATSHAYDCLPPPCKVLHQQLLEKIW